MWQDPYTKNLPAVLMLIRLFTVSPMVSVSRMLVSRVTNCEVPEFVMFVATLPHILHAGVESRARSSSRICWLRMTVVIVSPSAHVRGVVQVMRPTPLPPTEPGMWGYSESGSMRRQNPGSLRGTRNPLPCSHTAPQQRSRTRSQNTLPGTHAQ